MYSYQFLDPLAFACGVAAAARFPSGQPAGASRLVVAILAAQQPVDWPLLLEQAQRDRLAGAAGQDDVPVPAERRRDPASRILQRRPRGAALRVGRGWVRPDPHPLDDSRLRLGADRGGGGVIEVDAGHKKFQIRRPSLYSAPIRRIDPPHPFEQVLAPCPK